MRNSKYTKEFKDSTVQLVINGEKPASQIANDLDVNSKTLYSWIRAYKIANNMLIKSSHNAISKDENNSPKETFEAEAKRLRAENKLLKQERDILKKATAYFAKEVL